MLKTQPIRVRFFHIKNLFIIKERLLALLVFLELIAAVYHDYCQFYQDYESKVKFLIWKIQIILNPNAKAMIEAPSATLHLVPHKDSERYTSLH